MFEPKRPFRTVLEELVVGLRHGTVALDEHVADPNQAGYYFEKQIKPSNNPPNPLFAGKQLREIREQLGFTLRDVELASNQLAESRKAKEFIITPSSLQEIETSGFLPSIFHIYLFAAVYRIGINHIFQLYGLSPNSVTSDFKISTPSKTHVFNAVLDQGTLTIPVSLDAGFDTKQTANLGRLIAGWGTVPLSYLEELTKKKYLYAYIGSEDLTMYPLLRPGTFVQIDEDQTRIDDGPWRSEFERPIYLVETREGYSCCWCSIRRGEINLLPHPLSGLPPRTLKHPQEAEVVGKVVGVAMQLEQQPFRSKEDSGSSKLEEPEREKSRRLHRG